MNKIFFVSLFLISTFLLLGCSPNLTLDDEPPTDNLMPVNTTPSTLESIYKSIPITNTYTPVLTPTVWQPTVTPTPLYTMGSLEIVSEPPGADINIVESEITGTTPFSITLPPGDYTIKATLEKYESWEEIVTIYEGENSDLYVEWPANSLIAGQYIPLVELGGIGSIDERLYLEFVGVSSDRQGVIYALNRGWNRAETKDWLWYHYDLINKEISEIPGPQSAVSSETRTMLNLCPLDELPSQTGTNCNGQSSLVESDISELMVFSPILENSGNAGELWIANLDGANAQKLADFSPFYVNWSGDGQWFVTGRQFPGLPGQTTDFLAATDGSFFEDLQQISGVDNFFLNGFFPEFSPDGSSLLIGGSEVFESRDEKDYNLYVLDLDSFEHLLISNRFGLYQWAENGEGVYVLDGAFSPFDNSTPDETVSLYYVDIKQNPAKEFLIASGIPFYPKNAYGTWNWVYLPSMQAIVYVGSQDKLELGVLLLE